MVAKKGDKDKVNKSNLEMCYWKKPFALVLLLVMAATLLLALLPQPALAQTQITTCTELQNMSLIGNYYLGNDIDCSCTSGWNSGAGFEPIGNESNNFSGTFDGQGYKITGLYINRPSSDFVGLFGFTGTGSEIKDVGLEQVIVTGSWLVGGLVGYNDGQITNSYSTGSVDGDILVGGLVGLNDGQTTNSYSTGSVDGEIPVGGLVGRNDGTINNSYSSGDVSGDYYVGGLVGENDGTINNSYSSGDVSGDCVGGFVGWNDGTINNSYSSGCVTGSSEVGGWVDSNEMGTITNSYSSDSVTGSGDYVGGFIGISSGIGSSDVGGFVGWNDGTITNSYSSGCVRGDCVGGFVGYNFRGTITNCYSTGSVSGNEDVGGFVGYNFRGTITNSYWDIITSRQLSSAGGEGKTTTEMKQRATFENWDFVNIWAIVEDESYPYLQWQPKPPISVPVLSITGLVVVIGMMCLVLAVTVSRRRR